MTDIEKAVEKLSEHGLIRANRITGDYYSIYCPIHKDGTERKPSCGILLREQYKNGQRYPAGWCHCFTCGYAHTLPELVSDLLKARNMSGSGLDWLKQYVPGFDGSQSDIELLIPKDLMSSLTNNFALEYIRNITEPKSSYVSEEELASYRFTVPYMYERKLTDEIIELYDIGFDPNHVPSGRKKPLPCITFPVRDINGNTLFICRRSIEGKYFNYPTGITKPVYGLYEIPKGCKSLVICESCLDSHVSVRYGKPSVALLGTGNSYQINQLKQLGMREFVIFTDGDDAGRKAAAKLKKALQSVAIVWVVPTPDDKDVNSLTEEEFNELYDSKE